ncbi:MAG: lysophospholipid acyltransferase family protein [Marinilabiliaceae bacterium]|nr:lysophospholipid acyltransferase family protein [Marinilabiliaceae bacterium]
MSLLTTFLFYFFVLIISVLPFFVLYRFSDLLHLLMLHVVKYRIKVIIDNLKKAFPEKTEQELKILLKKFYRNLTDNLVESMKTFTMSKAAIVRRHKIVNPELLEAYFKEGKSIIGVTAHYCNWEWGSLSGSLQSEYKMVGFYKPMRNKRIDKIIRNSRSRCGTELVSIYETSNAFEHYKDQPTVFLMAADQSPSGKQLPKAYWYDFLGRRTAFLHGVEKHARNNNYTVVYMDIQRVKRGFYEVELSLLADNPVALKEGEVTERYVRKVESVIQKEPENWLWSHKRWKHTPKE